LVLQCINGMSSNPVEGRTKICQLKDLILTLFGLIFRRIYIWGVGSLWYSDTIPLSPWPYPILTMTLSYHHHVPIPSSPWFYPIITITLSHLHHDPILSSPWSYLIIMTLSHYHHDPIPSSPWPYLIIIMTLSHYHHGPIPSSPWPYLIIMTLSHDQNCSIHIITMALSQ
jgi:hypothetical protein